MFVGKDPLGMSKAGRWKDAEDRSAGRRSRGRPDSRHMEVVRQEMEEAGVR